MNTKITGEIIFYYTHPMLFDGVQHQSAYMCKNITTKEGEDISERYAITDDEEPMFHLCLADVVPDIYEALKCITYGINPAFYEAMSGTDFQALIHPENPDDSDDSDETDETDETEETNETEETQEEEPVTDTNTYVVFRVQDNGAYNPNAVNQVDAAILSAIEGGVLSNFYLRVTHPDLTKMSASMYTAQMQVLAKRIIPLRRKSAL